MTLGWWSYNLQLSVTFTWMVVIWFEGFSTNLWRINDFASWTFCERFCICLQ